MSAAAKYKNSIDIAPELKRFITILLLLIMAGQAAHILYSKPYALKSVQDTDDKKDNESKEDKEEKALIQHTLSFQMKFIPTGFNLAPVVIISSPVIDHLTPPPDRVSFY